MISENPGNKHCSAMWAHGAAEIEHQFHLSERLLQIGGGDGAKHSVAFVAHNIGLIFRERGHSDSRSTLDLRTMNAEGWSLRAADPRPQCSVPRQEFDLILNWRALAMGGSWLAERANRYR
jgi:hypothetical protein